MSRAQLVRFMENVALGLLLPGLLLALILLFAANIAHECTLPQPARVWPCDLWNSLRAFLISLPFPEVFATALFAAIAWTIRKLYLRLNYRPPDRDARFPFEQIGIATLLQQTASYPAIEVRYIPREEVPVAEALLDLRQQHCVLLAGTEGSGKTREAVELIEALDTPPGSVLVLRPVFTRLEDGFLWPTSVNFRQKRVVLFLDGLDDFEAIDNIGNYALHTTTADFERLMLRVIHRFEKKCDSVNVVATIRSNSDAWAKVSRRTDSRLWRRFKIFELPRRTWSEAFQYAAAVDEMLPHISLDVTALKLLADRFDGTFAGIRDFLKRKEAENSTASSPATLTARDIGDFTGVYPGDWNERYYDRFISRDAAAAAIFLSLSALMQAHITPYEPVALQLASRLMSKGPLWWRQFKCRRALDRLDTWVDRRNGVLLVPEAYVRGRVDLGDSLGGIAETLISLTTEGILRGRLLPDVLSLASTCGGMFERHGLALRLAKRGFEIDPSDPRVLHGLAIAYDKLGHSDRCVELCQKALLLDPEYLPSYTTLAVGLSKLKRYSEAIDVLTSAKHLLPTSANISLPLGIILDRLDRRDDAVAAFREVLLDEPENRAALISLTIALHRSGSPDEACRHLEKALALQPDDDSQYVTAIRLFPDLSRERAESLTATLMEVSRAHEAEIWTLRQLCKFFWRVGNEQAARDQMERIIAIPLHTADELWGVGELLHELRQYQLAIVYYERALEEDENHYKATAGLGEVWASLGDHGRAAEFFRRATVLSPSSPFAWSGLGGAMLHLGRSEDARAAFLRSLKLDRRNPYAWFAVSRLIQRAEDPKLESFIARTASRTRNPYAWFALGIVQRRKGDPQGAVASYQRASDLLPRDPLIWLGLADSLEHLGLLEDALAARKEVARLSPRSSLAHSYLATTYIALGLPSEAAEAARIAAELAPTNPSIVTTQGIAELILGKPDTALPFFQRAIDLNPKFGYAWSGSAQALYKLDKVKESFHAFKKAVDLGQDDPITLSGLGMTAKALGDLDTAEHSLRASLNKAENHPLPWSHLGEVLLRKDRLGDAVAAFQRAVALDDKNPKAWSGLGQCLNRLGRFEEAVDPHRKAIELGDSNFANYLGLGRSLYKAGHLYEAIHPLVQSARLAHGGPALQTMAQMWEEVSGDPSRQEVRDALAAATGDLGSDLAGIVTMGRARRALELAEKGSTDSLDLLRSLEANMPTQPQVVCIMSSAYRHLGHMQDAIEAGLEATRLDPGFAQAWYTLGRAYEEARETSNAREAYETALRLAPGYGKARGALGRVS